MRRRDTEKVENRDRSPAQIALCCSGYQEHEAHSWSIAYSDDSPTPALNSYGRAET